MDANESELETLRWQFALVWRLAAHHLPLLTDEACLWEPAAGSWTVRKGFDGRWRADWAEPEPEPAPPVTIGWLTWHVLWWWENALHAVRDEPVPPREQILWPSSAAATVDALNALSAQWSGILRSKPNPERPVAYPWSEPRPLRLLLAWANCELMKNVAEIGVVRHHFAASHHPG